MKKQIIFVALLAMGQGISLAHSCGLNHDVATVEIVNDCDIKRVNEIVAINNNFGDSVIVYDIDNHEIPSQITYDGKLIFPVSIESGAKAEYRITKGLKHTYPTIAYGRFVPERDDDFAWENDLTAYRAYGPETCRKGGKAYGYDVWTKKVSFPIIDKRYYDHLKGGKSYHTNHGDGMDVYAVGPTLGAGTAALLASNGQPSYNSCFEEYEILDNGPLRFTFKLYYPGEERIISLDAGSHFNYTQVKFTNRYDSHKVCIGIVSHSSDTTDCVMDKDGSVTMLGYEDPTDTPCDENGEIYVGALLNDSSAVTSYLPLPEKQGLALGHYIISADLPSYGTLCYWWGTGWSHADVENIDKWHRILSDKAYQIHHPLKIIVN